MKATIARSCSLKIAIKIVKFTSILTLRRWAKINKKYCYVDVLRAIFTQSYQPGLEPTTFWSSLRRLLHCATCRAILLRHKLHEKLHCVTYPEIIKSRNIFVAASVARSRIKFYFSQRLRQRCNGFLNITQCNTPLATCLAMFCAISQ